MIMAHRLLHVVQISFFSDPEERSPAELLDAWSTLVDVSEAVFRAKIRVSVVQACTHSEHLERNGVDYYFLPFGAMLPASRAQNTLSELLRELAPDVLHVHGLNFPRDVLSLKTLAPGVPIILQDHASQPPRPWRRAAWRRSIAAAAGIAFCSLEQARPFATAGLLHQDTHVYQIPESTSRFTPGDKEQARRTLEVSGNPLVLWVGHLDENKDPLTVLDGISKSAQAFPDLQLWCCFGAAPLLRAVRNRIAADPALGPRVHLLGRVPHERVEHLMRAADIFALGSHREGSGYSLIEALACGLLPVVTDIPSFRSLTAAGTVGKLWPCGDSHAFCEALRFGVAQVGPGMRATVRTHFERELSFEALGSKLATMYADVVGRKRGGSARSAGTLAQNP